MNLRQAVKVVENLRRYSATKRKSYWSACGPLVPQHVIPMCTKAQENKARRVIDAKTSLRAIRWVDVSRLRSTQRSLRFKSLMWNVKHFDRTQRSVGSKRVDMDIRGVSLPIIVWADGLAVIWNGNHRVTAAILLGRGRVLVRMYKLARGTRRPATRTKRAKPRHVGNRPRRPG